MEQKKKMGKEKKGKTHICFTFKQISETIPMTAKQCIFLLN